MRREGTRGKRAVEGPTAPSVLVLLSGGVDSTACAAFYRSQRYDVSALFVEYGQGALRQERRAALRIAKQAAIPLTTVAISGLGPFGKGYIPARNALLLMAALSHWQARKGMIALGIHAGTTYADCSQGFVDAVQRLFDVYTDGRARLTCPFLAWTKAQVWAYCREAGVPLDLTYSCERGGDRPCGRCLSCKDRRALRELR
jgi:7-cyano-7-deazaguanine synthase